MASHASVLAWRIPRTEEPGGLSPQVTESDTAEATAQETQSIIRGDKHRGGGHHSSEEQRPHQLPC